MAVRKIVVAATSLALMASMSAPAFADDGGKHGNADHNKFFNFKDTAKINYNFEDVDNYGWALQAIYKLAGEGIIQGEGDENHHDFNPGGQLTRADFSTLLQRFFNLQTPSPAQQDFQDVKPDSWYFNAVEAAKSYMTQFTDPNGGYDFRPDAPMNRAETAVTLVEILLKENAVQLVSNDQTNQILSAFTDAGLIPSGLRAYVATAIQNGLMNGVGNNQFDPLGELNRAQAAVLLYRLQTQFEVPPTGTTSNPGGTSTEVPPGSTPSTGLSDQLAAPSTVTAGTTNNYTLTVYQNGSVDTALNGSYNVTIATNAVGVSPVATTVNFVNGIATVPVTLNKVGQQTVTISVSNLNLNATASVTVNAGSSSGAALFVNGSRITGSNELAVTVNTPAAVVIEPVDAQGNPTTATTATLYQLSDNGSNGAFRLSPSGANINTIQIPAGASNVTLYYVNGTTGSYNLSASPIATLSGQLAFPPAAVTHGVTTNVAFTVYQNGIIDTNFNGTYDVTISTTNAGGASATSPVTFINGVVTVPVILNSAGAQTVTVSIAQLTVSASATVNSL